MKRAIFNNDQSKSIVKAFNNLFSKMIPNFSTIKRSAFKNCSSLEQISIPPINRKIECRAFYCCNSLNKIDLPSIIEIGAGAFCDCLALKQISMSSQLLSIELAAFENFRSLESVYINNSTNVDILS